MTILTFPAPTKARPKRFAVESAESHRFRKGRIVGKGSDQLFPLRSGRVCPFQLRFQTCQLGFEAGNPIFERRVLHKILPIKWQSHFYDNALPSPREVSSPIIELYHVLKIV